MSSIASRRKHARRESSPGYDERRQRLLTGAADVFKEKGYQAASMSEIAERFGGDRASVYYYYGSKHEIFLDIIRQAVEEVVLDAEAVADRPEPADVRLELALTTTMRSYERHYPYMYVYIQEDMRKVPGDGSAAGEELKALGIRFENALLRMINDGLDTGVFRTDLDAGMMMFALSGVVNWTHRWFTPGGRLSGEDVGHAFARIILDGLRSRPVRPKGRPTQKSPSRR